MKEDLSTLDLVQLYDRLIQPEAPAAVSMLPQTAGWIWLLVGVLGIAGTSVWMVIRQRRASAYRRAALVALQAAGDDPAAIANILRRTALSAFPRDTVAGLYGSQWLNFLDGVSEGVRFSGTDAGKALLRAPYVKTAAHSELPFKAERWIKTHRAPGSRT